MAYKFVKRKISHLNEDDAAAQQQAPAANPQQGTTPAQPNQQAAPAANQAAAPNAAQQQNAQQQGPDMAAAVANANKFMGEVFTAVQQQISQNMVKSCPELDVILKNQNSPFKEEIGKMKASFDAFTKMKINPADANTTAQAVTAFSTFVTDFTALSKKMAESAAGQQQNGQQPQQNAQPNQQQAPAAAPGTAPQKESAQYTGFGQLLAEKMQMNQYMRSIGQNW